VSSPEWSFAAPLIAALALVGCNNEYTSAPTFCDDWCHATLRTSCGEEPDTCVRDCELTKASGDCKDLQQKLLSCYEGAAKSAFVCAGSGFRQETRVKPEVCQRERDAMYECEAPGIGTCLNLCRTIQQQQLDRTLDSKTGLVDFSLLAVDAGARPPCPAFDQPCEALCFSLVGFSSQSLSNALADSHQVYAPDAGPKSQSEIRDCIQSELLACYGPVASVADAGGSTRSPSGVESIGDVIMRCTGSH
jgi:hypothetical protein